MVTLLYMKGRRATIAKCKSYVMEGFSHKNKTNSSPNEIQTQTTRGMKFSSQKLYH